MIAGFIILRLRSILGRKTGHDSKVYPSFSEKKFSIPQQETKPVNQNLEVLEGKQKKEFKVKQTKPVVICIFDKNLMKEYISLQMILRSAGISTEIYPGEGKLKKQMEYANKIKSPAVILYGENEIKTGKPTLRNLVSGNEKSTTIKELANEIKKIV